MELLNVVLDFLSTHVESVRLSPFEFFIVDLTIASVYVTHCIYYLLHAFYGEFLKFTQVILEPYRFFDSFDILDLINLMFGLYYCQLIVAKKVVAAH
jgi:hypothetical protein